MVYRDDTSTTDTRILTALARGPLTQAQIDQRLGFARYGSKYALARLLAKGAIAKEASDQLVGRTQFRAVKA